jgi:hypothetical protein
MGLSGIEDNRAQIMAWLTEKNDREELKTNISMLMEFGILILVGIEVVHLIRHWCN